MHHLSLLILAVALASPVKHESPFACNLNGLTITERARHFVYLGPMLRSRKTGMRELQDGYEFRFPSDGKTIAMLAEWIEQERRCCPFFDIDLRFEREGGPVWMRLTGREGTKQFIQAEAAAWIKQ
jgi:hypothetical protein